MGSKLHFWKERMPCFLSRTDLKSVKKFLVKMGAVFLLPRWGPSGSIEAKNVALLGRLCVWWRLFQMFVQKYM